MVKRRLIRRVLASTQLAPSTQHAIATLIGYVIITIGLLVILQMAGINLTTLNVLAGAVGIGVGFGLQNIASNFISGLIILAERPIKVGDRVEGQRCDRRGGRDPRPEHDHTHERQHRHHRPQLVLHLGERRKLEL